MAKDPQFSLVNDIKTLDDLIQRSENEPVILFKHSDTCPISSDAYDEMTKLGLPVSMVIVQTARNVSNEIELRTGIRHESPQTLIVRSGKVVWSASHRGVKAGLVRQALEAVR